MNKQEYNKLLVQIDEIINNFINNVVLPVCPDSVDIYDEKKYKLYFFFGIPNIGNFNIKIKQYKEAKTLCNPIVDIIRIYAEFETWRDISNLLSEKYSLPSMNDPYGKYDLISMDYHVQDILIPQLNTFIKFLSEIITGG